MSPTSKRRLVAALLLGGSLVAGAALMATGKFWRMSQFGGEKIFFDPDTLATGQILAHVTKDPNDASTLTGANLYSAYKAVDFPAQTIPLVLSAVTGIQGPGSTPLLLPTAGTTVNTQAFDASTDEAASMTLLLPSTMKSTGTVNVKLRWTEGTAEASKAVHWNLFCINASTGDSIDVAATYNATVSSASSNSTTTLHSAEFSPTLTTLGWAAGDQVHIKISRDADGGGDNFGSDALLHSASISVPIDPVQE